MTYYHHHHHHHHHLLLHHQHPLTTRTPALPSPQPPPQPGFPDFMMSLGPALLEYESAKIGVGYSVTNKSESDLSARMAVRLFLCF
jgi:hypothetical protein